ncbi:hypothetical protein [Marinobacter sp. ELB17]|uniref:hypothetical protein n=1 Tax=Marinobacter sp. ELB17 TaxID=270374 RepID=UPI0000F39A47|nr:hypothetical protein [Marinobacter sp. ELB17]EAZ99679.1 hypothetical protein MELB17_11766 [Marinobacter sp. ELB17]
MKKIIIAVAATVFFSAMASANSGLADRISDARSYPNKTESIKVSESLKIQHEKIHAQMQKLKVKANDPA